MAAVMRRNVITVQLSVVLGHPSQTWMTAPHEENQTDSSVNTYHTPVVLSTKNNSRYEFLNHIPYAISCALQMLLSTQ